MNAKLLKERIKTKAQRPDIVVAYHNFLLRRDAEERDKDLQGAEKKRSKVRRTA